MKPFALAALAGLLLAGCQPASPDVSISAKNPAGVSDSRTDSPAAPPRRY